MSELPRHPAAASDETTWESGMPGKVVLQRKCPDCDGGLLLAPARYHRICGGYGYLTRVVDA